MIRFHVMAFAGRSDEMRTIADLTWPVIPRVGEIIVLNGPHFGDSLGKKHGEDGEFSFEVESVQYTDGPIDPDTNRTGEDGPDVRVCVRQAMFDAQNIRLRCACKAPRPTQTNPDRCDECDGDISPVGR